MGERAEETNSGVRKEGDIEDIAEFAREVEEVMKEEEAGEQSINEFNEWRPREDDGKEDIERRTVQAASLSQKEMEERSEGVKDIADAGEEAVKVGKKLGKRQSPESEVKDASRKFFQPFYSVSAKIARNLEKKVYSNLMLKFNPYFFDSSDFSADLRERDDDYVIDVDVSDKSSRDALKEQLARNE